MSDKYKENKPWIVAFGLIALLGIAGLAGAWLNASILPTEHDWMADFWARFQVMFVFAVLIERATEVYLQITDSNGPDRFSTAMDMSKNNNGKSDGAAVTAGYVSFFMALIVALVGVRLVGTMGTLQTAGHPLLLTETLSYFESRTDSSDGAVFSAAADALKNALETLGNAPEPAQHWSALLLWFGIDVTISAGLMAGGATLFHEVAEALRGGLGRLGESMALSSQERSAMLARRNAGSPAYLISMSRSSTSEGVLSFTHDSNSVEAKIICDPNFAVTEGIYNDCSKTHLEMKVDAAGTLSPVPVIWIPSASKTERIGIRAGEHAKNANGSFLVAEEKFKELHSAIQPLDGRNIQVVIKDV
ncbi:hypothetical protein [Roseovarius sp. M141]|uniref:hypothetical protein n=1 Tax=Roseovarius sp. M141 TaxID=2583806 RepID=UPI0020CFB43A|nr:hypothetical protein [Roseovarius sp. M141]MCQ0093385.1 hypothetical protein [Roseovarius sp. M141]